MSSFERVFFANRTTRQVFDLYARDGATPIQLQADDYVRFSAGRGGDDPSPILDLVNGSETDGGSGIDVITTGDGTTPAQVAVIVGENETIHPGTYSAQFDIVDESVASPVVNPTTPGMFGVIHILDHAGGSTGQP
jgi:hypothetical protein